MRREGGAAGAVKDVGDAAGDGAEEEEGGEEEEGPEAAEAEAAPPAAAGAGVAGAGTVGGPGGVWEMGFGWREHRGVGGAGGGYTVAVGLGRGVDSVSHSPGICGGGL